MFDTADKILSLAEMYFKRRGNRQITRPNQIRENFERTCDFMLFKIIDFERQAKDFCSKIFLEVIQLVNIYENNSLKVIRMSYDEIAKHFTKTIDRVTFLEFYIVSHG